MMKIEISLEEIRKIIKSNGGLENMVVFGCYTYPKGIVRADGYMTKERDIYTEWGKLGSTTPLIAHHLKGNNEKYYKFKEEK